MLIDSFALKVTKGDNKNRYQTFALKYVYIHVSMDSMLKFMKIYVKNISIYTINYQKTN